MSIPNCTASQIEKSFSNITIGETLTKERESKEPSPFVKEASKNAGPSEYSVKDSSDKQTPPNPSLVEMSTWHKSDTAEPEDKINLKQFVNGGELKPKSELKPTDEESKTDKLKGAYRHLSDLQTRLHDLLFFPQCVTELNVRIKSMFEGDIKFDVAPWLAEVKQEKLAYDAKTAAHEFKCAEHAKHFKIGKLKTADRESKCNLDSIRFRYKILLLTYYSSNNSQITENKELKQSEVDVISSAKERLDRLLVGVSEDSFGRLIVYYETIKKLEETYEKINALRRSIKITKEV